MIQRDRNIANLPESEVPVQIGQWAPWVGVALVIIAAVVAKFADPQSARVIIILDGSRWSDHSTIQILTRGWEDFVRWVQNPFKVSGLYQVPVYGDCVAERDWAFVDDVETAATFLSTTPRRPVWLDDDVSQASLLRWKDVCDYHGDEDLTEEEEHKIKMAIAAHRSRCEQFDKGDVDEE